MILARTSTINHPMGPSLETPFLIPSFSSKGKRIRKIRNSKIYSEIHDIIDLMNDNCALTRYYLISAYDMFYKALPEKEKLPRTDMIFIDSGGYEVSDFVEGNSQLQHRYATLPWDKDKYYEVLHSWQDWNRKELLPAVLITYDHPKQRMSFENQIEAALELKSCFPGQLYDFLIKPEKKGQKIYNKTLTEKVIPQINKLDNFDIIGLTEKELGNTISDRLDNIKKLRIALNKQHINKPIHIFGGLDPTLALLYFLAGAEIFDGVSWSRYQFDNGISTYHYNFKIKDVKLNQREELIFSLMMTRNLSLLAELEMNMRTYKEKQNFSHFDYMTDVYERLSASI